MQHSVIRDVVIVFGSLFKNIKVKTYNNDGSIKGDKVVPISFSDKRNYELWLSQQAIKDGQVDMAAIGRSLPRLSFSLESLSRNNQIQFNPVNYTTNMVNGKALKAYSPVPYSFSFQLHIWTKDYDSGLQIIDQIIPWFNPDMSVRIKENPQLGISNSVNINLGSVSLNDNYKDGLTANSILNWTLTFTLNANIWANRYTDVSEEIIREIDIDYYDSLYEDFSNNCKPKQNTRS